MLYVRVQFGAVLEFEFKSSLGDSVGLFHAKDCFMNRFVRTSVSKLAKLPNISIVVFFTKRKKRKKGTLFFWFWFLVLVLFDYIGRTVHFSCYSDHLFLE